MSSPNAITLWLGGRERVARRPVAQLERVAEQDEPRPERPVFISQLYCAPGMTGRGLGPQYDGDLFVGNAAFDDTLGGYLYRFNLTGNRRKIAVDDPRLDAIWASRVK